jgi:ABC-type transporter Mla subunit MlaD
MTAQTAVDIQKLSTALAAASVAPATIQSITTAIGPALQAVVSDTSAFQTSDEWYYFTTVNAMARVVAYLNAAYPHS